MGLRLRERGYTVLKKTSAQSHYRRREDLSRPKLSEKLGIPIKEFVKDEERIHLVKALQLVRRREELPVTWSTSG